LPAGYWTLMAMARSLKALPKAELHLHLLGAMRYGTLARLADAAGVPVPDVRGFKSFKEFLKVFDAVHAVVCKRADNLRILIREAVADAASDGVVWLQPHLDPHAYPEIGTPDEVMELIVAEGTSAGVSHNVGFGVTLSVMRQLGPESAEDRARFAVRWSGNGVQALGLSGDEDAYPPDLFVRAFAIAREAGLQSAPHAGERAGPNSVRDAVERLGATRIAHGVRAAEDAELTAALAQRAVSLDISLTSNLRLGVVRSLAEHPLRALLEAGVECSLGADDPLMFGATLLDEYQTARHVIGLEDQQLAMIARTSIAAGGAPGPVKAAALGGIDAWLAEAPVPAPDQNASVRYTATGSTTAT